MRFSAGSGKRPFLIANRALLGYMDERGLRVADARREAVDEWTRFVTQKGRACSPE